MSLGEGGANKFQWLLFLQILHGLGSPFRLSVRKEFLKVLMFSSNSSNSFGTGLKSTPDGIFEKSSNPSNSSDNHILFSVLNPSCSVLAKSLTMVWSLKLQKADSTAGCTFEGSRT